LLLKDKGVRAIIHVSRVLDSFHIGPGNPYLPTRLFSPEDEAQEWLKGYLE
jgi:hypothetical protein